ncbi:hypothetical protein Tdes44962_MAKER03459 [Teratosphaeria destructans]|uniref:Uncharacterized protein n=1 Tax=Teratosphaeria destructans TaxID=418781 RepID=A0A9W7SQ02_9PEZI|nr:hypothetical protein Tdes44962_MAKER03459 [Teratosphaeria destructans]
MPRLRPAGTGPSTGASNRNGRGSDTDGAVHGVGSAQTDTIGGSTREDLSDARGAGSLPKSKRRTLSNFFGFADEPGERRDTVHDDGPPAARLSKRHSMLNFHDRNEAADHTHRDQQNGVPTLRTSQSVNFESVQQPSRPSVLRKMKSKLNLRDTGSAFISRLNHRPSLASILPQQFRSDYAANVDDDCSSTSTVRGISPTEPLPMTDLTSTAEFEGEYSPSHVHSDDHDSPQAPANSNHEAARGFGHAKVDSRNTNDINGTHAHSHKRNGQLYENGVVIKGPSDHDSTLVAGAQGHPGFVDTPLESSDYQTGEGNHEAAQLDASHERADEDTHGNADALHAGTSDGNVPSTAICTGTRYEEMPQGDNRFAAQPQAMMRADRGAFVLGASRCSILAQQEEGWDPLIESSRQAERRTILAGLSERFGSFSFNREGTRDINEDPPSPTAGSSDGRKDGLWPFGKGKQRQQTVGVTDQDALPLDFDTTGQTLHKKASDLIRSKSWRTRVNAGFAVPDVDHQSTDEETVDTATRDSNRRAAYAALNGEAGPSPPAPSRTVRRVKTQPAPLRSTRFEADTAPSSNDSAQQVQTGALDRAVINEQSVGHEDGSPSITDEPIELEDTSEAAVTQALIDRHEQLQAEQPFITLTPFQRLITWTGLVEFRASLVRSQIVSLQSALAKLVREETEHQRKIVQLRYALKTRLRHASPRQALAVYDELEMRTAASLVDWASEYCDARFQRAMLGHNQDWDLELGRYFESGQWERRILRQSSRLTLNLTAIEEQDDDDEGAETKTIKRSSLPKPSVSLDGSVYAAMMERPDATESGESEQQVVPVMQFERSNGVVDGAMLNRPRAYQRYSWHWA